MNDINNNSNCAESVIFDDFTPENITKIEAILNHERTRYYSRLRKNNQFYIQKLKLSNYSYNNNIYTFKQIHKLIYITFDDIKQEWKIKNTERH